ncbi:Scr1 family TA system antitoxin-like transcriptional regulator, partial [Micromonospora chokoriensis]
MAGGAARVRVGQRPDEPGDGPAQRRGDAADQHGGAGADGVRPAGREPAAARVRPWAELEQDAISIRSYQPLLVPGLLQTEGYA